MAPPVVGTEWRTDFYLIVEAAFGNGPLDASPTWTDITDDVRGFLTSRGRNHELRRFEAGTIDMILDNRHGNYNPHNTAGSYSPNVKPAVPIRIRAWWNEVYYRSPTGSWRSGR